MTESPENTTPSELPSESESPNAQAHPPAPPQPSLDPMERFRKIMKDRENITARVVKWQRNGLEMELEDGVKAFMPNDMIDRDPNRNIANYFGKTLPVRITNVKGAGKHAEIHVSHRAVIEDELRRQGRETLQELNVGDTVSGKVKGFNKEGAFIDLGPGVEALVRTRDISWASVEHPYEALKRGDDVTAKIINLDKGRRRVQLGIRQLTPDPSIEQFKKFEVDQVVTGRVTRIGEFGAELELEPGVVAFLPISEISWSRIPTVADAVTADESMEVKIIRTDLEDRSITVSKKQLVENPLRKIESTYRVNTDHNGTIKEINKGGIVVSLEHGAEGFIPRRELSHDRIERLEDVFKIGKPLEGLRVIEYDKRNGKVTMSAIAAEREAQRTTLKNYKATSKESSFAIGDLAALKEKLQKLEQGGQ